MCYTGGLKTSILLFDHYAHIASNCFAHPKLSPGWLQAMGVILDSLDMAVIDFHRRCSMAIMPKVLIFFGFCGEKYSQEMNFQDYKLNMRHTRSHFLVLLMAVLDRSNNNTWFWCCQFSYFSASAPFNKHHIPSYLSASCRLGPKQHYNAAVDLLFVDFSLSKYQELNGEN